MLFLMVFWYLFQYCTIILLPLVCLEENLEKGLLAYQHTAGPAGRRLAQLGQQALALRHYYQMNNTLTWL